jgi:SAM-dependent methyltransferase
MWQGRHLPAAMKYRRRAGEGWEHASYCRDHQSACRKIVDETRKLALSLGPRHASTWRVAADASSMRDMANRVSSRKNLASDRFPSLPMLDIYLPMMRCAAVLAGGQLGVFERLSRGEQTSAELASGLHVAPESLKRLLEALREAGYVKSRPRDRWRNSKQAKRWFTSSGKIDYTAGLLWTADAWRIMADLSDVVRQGRPERQLWDQMREQPELGEHFSRYMHAFALHASPLIARKVTLPRDARHVLDIGGSHGLHSIALCKKYPRLRSTVLDHASALTDTQKNAQQHGFDDRITCLAGDCRVVPFPEDLDAVLLYSVMHNHTPAENQELFARIAAALRPKGRLVMHDYLRGAMPEDYRTLFDLTLLTEVGTRTYELAELRAWAANAGFDKLKVHHLTPSEMGSVLVAQRR